MLTRNSEECLATVQGHRILNLLGPQDAAGPPGIFPNPPTRSSHRRSGAPQLCFSTTEQARWATSHHTLPLDLFAEYSPQHEVGAPRNLAGVQLMTFARCTKAQLMPDCGPFAWLLPCIDHLTQKGLKMAQSRTGQTMCTFELGTRAVC